jgi:opacity protein-like surface antigen
MFRVPFLSRFASAIACLFVLMGVAHAQKVPDATLQEILIKVSLLTFNDANVTGNYTVLHAKLSKPFRDQFPPEKLKDIYKAFNEKHIDFDLIAARPPVPAEEAKIDDRGILMLKGYFDTKPSRVNYDLGFIMSDGEWKLVKLNVDVKKVD